MNLREVFYIKMLIKGELPKLKQEINNRLELPRLKVEINIKSRSGYESPGSVLYQDAHKGRTPQNKTRF